MRLPGSPKPAMRWATVTVVLVDSLLFLADALFGGNDPIGVVLLLGIGLLNLIAFNGALRRTEVVAPPTAKGTSARNTALRAGKNRTKEPSAKLGADRPWRSGTVIVAQLAALPYFIFPLRTELYADTHEWHLPSTGTATAITVVLGLLAVAAIVIVGAGAHARSVQIASNSYAVFLALVIPLASSAATYYSAYYLPQHQRPLINVDASLARESTSRGITNLQATMTLKNDGSTDVVFLEALYTVTAYHDPPLSAAQLTRSTRGYRDPQQAFKDARSSYGGLIRVGRLVRRGGHLTRGQNFTTTVNLAVRSDVGQTLRLTVLLAALADNGQQIDNSFKRCSPLPQRSFECWKVPLPTHGWLNAKLSDNPTAQVSLVASKPDGVPQLDTEFRLGGAPATNADKAETVFPFINSRIFTTSVDAGIP